MIYFHNHPQGYPLPSLADEQITKQLKEVLTIFDINSLDHIIVAGKETFSFAESGLM